MSRILAIHPENPQSRLINQVTEIICKGGVVVIPSDCAYVIACHLGDKRAVDRIKRIRQLDDKHNFTLMCDGLSAISTYAKIDNATYRLIKANTPGAYTFILNATSIVPRRLLHPKRRTIGIRIPDNPIVLSLLSALGEPLMTSSMIMPGDEDPLFDPWEIHDLLKHQVDLVVDGGYCGLQTTTVVSLLDHTPDIIREGAGDISPFE